VSNVNKNLFELTWKGELSEYITDLTWSKNDHLAVSSANGEVMVKLNQPQLILPSNQEQNQINTLTFSPDGQFLASGGQDGKLRIWQLPDFELIDCLDWGLKWLECLRWHPQQPYLAFNQGRYVQIWDVISQEIITTLNFDNSSVLDLNWDSQGKFLAIAGDGGVKIWSTQNWDDEPIYLEMAGAATKIKWSADGQYLAAICIDQSVLLWRWGNNSPWRLSGFSGKIRNLVWSEINLVNSPLLAVSSRGDIVLWKKEKIETKGWASSTLGLNDNLIEDLAFQPQSLMLASGGEDGYICLWKYSQKLVQKLTGIKGGCTRLQWNLSGNKLAIGSDDGEILIFSKSKRSQGFG
jgi:WD40 repeat protein